MKALLLLAAAAWASGPTYSAKLVVFDPAGKPLDAPALLEHIGRADKRGAPALWVWSPDWMVGVRPVISQKGKDVVLSWRDTPRAVLSLPWPIPEDGFSTVLVDREGQGISDGDVIRLNEEIALTQYRLFKEAWTRHAKDMVPQYEPGGKAQEMAEAAKNAVMEAQKARDTGQRSKLFDLALRHISLAWQKTLVEHGHQIANNKATRAGVRFGLTLDAGLLARINDYRWIADAIEASDTNWVRLVFRANPNDFAYEKQASFNEYDAIVKELRSQKLKIMGCMLDTAQWPSSLTPEVYARRTHNLVLHFKGQINSWEIGNELNGDWLGGSRAPLSPDDVFAIFTAAAQEARSLEPGLELVATLYWWEGTAPDETRALFGWLKKYGARLSKLVDVVGLSLQPEDNPVGLALERVFQQTRQALPNQKLMVGSLGYVEGEQLKGFWWLDPKDVDGGRKDLITLITPGAAALPGSVGGGFWWQTLEQMLPNKNRSTDLFKVYKRTLDGLGR